MLKEFEAVLFVVPADAQQFDGLGGCDLAGVFFY